MTGHSLQHVVSTLDTMFINPSTGFPNLQLLAVEATQLAQSVEAGESSSSGSDNHQRLERVRTQITHVLRWAARVSLTIDRAIQEVQALETTTEGCLINLLSNHFHTFEAAFHTHETLEGE